MHLLSRMLKSMPVCLWALAFFYVTAASAQESIKVSGKVTDNNGAPLVGVTVTVKGTKNSVVSGADGAFSISVPGASSVLVFSYVGYQGQESPVGSQTVFEVRLAQSSANMNEVVVVGYGTQKKREITSAITRVDAEQFNKGNISDVSQLLQIGRAHV